MKIGVKGYQSLLGAVIEVNPGEVVILRGANNTGKSAFIRAVSAFITNNPTGEEYINEEVGSVRVVIKDDKTYEWRRLKNTAFYLVDGKEEQKLNRASIAEIMPDSGFLYVKSEGDKFLPQILPEGSMWFPYNQNPSVAFRVFSKFMAPPKIATLISDVKDAIKEGKQSLLTVRGKIDAYETQISKLEEETKNFPPVEEVDLFLDRVARWIAGKQKCESLKIRLKNDREIKEKNAKILENVEEKKKEMRELEERIDGYIKVSGELETLRNKVAEYVEKKKRIGEIRIRIKELKEFVDNVGPRLKNMLEKRELAAKLREKISYKKKVSDRLEIAKGVYEEKGKEIKAFNACPLCDRIFENG